MNIGIDLDHTITDSPVLFKILAESLIAAKHNVYIISWREDQHLIIRSLKQYDISYTAIINPTPKERKGKCPYSHGLHVGKDSAKWKRKIAFRHKIDIMIDDSPEVLNAMPSETQTLWLVDRNVFNLEHALQGMRCKGDARLPTGTQVETLVDNGAEDWDEKAKDTRKWGVKGRIIAEHDSHGLTYEVLHEDQSIGHYEPEELKVIRGE